jgi:PDZ domain-containing protein
VTVNFQGGPGNEINIFTALRAWLNPHDAVVPQQEVFGTGQTEQQVQRQDVAQMAGSQQTATAAALTELGIPFTTRAQVVTAERGMPAADVLKRGDIITAVNGRPVRFAALSSRVSAVGIGHRLQLTVIRGRKTLHRGLTVAKGARGRPAIGVLVQPRYRFPFTVNISVGNIGGPSAGLMFALGIVDKLGPADLTGGRFIAGTGEIGPNGAVGPIGGIQQKMAGARVRGATVFLVPAGNCADAARAAPAGLRLVKVSTLAGAVRSLEALNAGRPVPSC